MHRTAARAVAPCVTIVPARVTTSRFHPPEIPPTLLPASSTTKSRHAPFATDPLSDDKVRPPGAPAGAGAGKLSPGSKSVGRYVPETIGPVSGIVTRAASSNVRFRSETLFAPPTSDISVTTRPLGLASMMSTSSGEACVKFCRLTRTFETGSFRSVRFISEGYGDATPLSGIDIEPEF